MQRTQIDISNALIEMKEIKNEPVLSPAKIMKQNFLNTQLILKNLPKKIASDAVKRQEINNHYQETENVLAYLKKSRPNFFRRKAPEICCLTSTLISMGLLILFIERHVARVASLQINAKNDFLNTPINFLNSTSQNITDAIKNCGDTNISFTCDSPLPTGMIYTRRQVNDLEFCLKILKDICDTLHMQVMTDAWMIGVIVSPMFIIMYAICLCVMLISRNTIDTDHRAFRNLPDTQQNLICQLYNKMSGEIYDLTEAPNYPVAKIISTLKNSKNHLINEIQHLENNLQDSKISLESRKNYSTKLMMFYHPKKDDANRHEDENIRKLPKDVLNLIFSFIDPEEDFQLMRKRLG